MKNKLLYYFLKVALNLCLATCNWKVREKNILKQAQERRFPILICCWHSRFLLVAYYFKTIKLSVWAVSSTHRDSQIMAKILSRWGFQLIRGSSTRGWITVLKQMITIFKNNNSIIAITNDGPKGPPLIAKAGSIKAAIKSGAQIIAVTGEAERFWSLPSWDNTIIPKPFSTIHIQYSAPLQYTGDTDSAAVTEYINKNYSLLQQNIN